MRTIQLVNAQGVIETFITDERTPLDAFNAILAHYGAQLIEGAGAIATPISDVVQRQIARTFSQRAFLEEAEDGIVRVEVEPARAASGVPEFTAPPAPPGPRPRDLRETALGGGHAPLPRKGTGAVPDRPSDDLILRPGSADGLGRTEVLEVRGGEVKRVPAWRPRQLEHEDVERVPGAPADPAD